MAVYRDIDSDVRINGSLTLPSGSLIIGGINIINALNGKASESITITAGTGLNGGGNLTTNRTLSIDFGTTAGTVAEGNHTHSFSSLTSRPTTLAGYGITDAASSGHTHTFASITSKPTTLAGYGITDAASSGHNHDTIYLKLSGGTLTGSLTFSPSAASTAVASIFGTNTTQKSYIYFNAASGSNDPGYIMHETSGTAAVANVGVIHLSPTDDNARGDYVTIHGTNDPETIKLHTDGHIETTGSVNANLGYYVSGTSVIESDAKIDWDRIKNAPSTYAPSAHTHLWAHITDKPTAFNPIGHTHAIADITGLSTALSGKSDTGHTHTFTSLTSKPTTLAGYGITDAATSGHHHNGTYVNVTGDTMTGTLTLSQNTQYPLKLDSAGVNQGAIGIQFDGVGNGSQIGHFYGNHLDGSAPSVSTNGYSFHVGSNVVNTDFVLDSPGVGNFYVGTHGVWHAGNFTPSSKADASALTSHTGDTNIHKSWGLWSTNGGQDFLGRGKRALVATTTNLIINYGGDFTNVNVQSDLLVNGSQVWHAGNLNKSDFLTSTAVASVVSNFTINGRAWVGSTGNTGSIILRNGSGTNSIYIDAGDAGSVSNHKIYLNGKDGSAVYAGNVRVATLTVDSTTLVRNLNAEFIGGTKETEFVRTPSIRDIRGYGVHTGLEVKQKSPTPDMSVEVTPGIAYTDSGRRYEWTALKSLPVTEASTNYDRYDIVYVQGSKIRDTNGSVIPSGNNEGLMSVWTGAAGANPTVEYSTFYNQFPDAVILGTVLVRANIGTITDGTSGSFDAIDNAPKKLMNVRLAEGTSYAIDETVFIKGDIYEKGSKLESKYARLATANTFTGDIKISRNNATLTVESANGNSSDSYPATLYLKEDAVYQHGLKVEYMGSGNYAALSTVNTGTSTERIRMWRDQDLVEIKTDVTVSGHIKSAKTAETVTIPAGQTSASWAHNYGNANYAVNLTSNSFERHVRWTSKSTNSIVVEIDTPSNEDILVDCILIGY
jgi:hypothetical protein